MATAEEDACNAEGARRPPSGDDADLISGLDDDVLLRVLALVGDARDVVRTGALSRRWLGLWTRAPAPRFASRPVPRAASGDEHRAALDQFVSVADVILLRRSAQSDCAVESLDISYGAADDSEPELNLDQPMPEHSTMEHLMSASVDAAQRWIRYAFQHGVKSDHGPAPAGAYEHFRNVL